MTAVLGVVCLTAVTPLVVAAFMECVCVQPWVLPHPARSELDGRVSGAGRT